MILQTFALKMAQVPLPPGTTAFERRGNNFIHFTDFRAKNGSSQGLDCPTCALFARKMHAMVEGLGLRCQGT
jgi:hypothetical protein